LFDSETGWLDVYWEAVRLWLGAEHGRLKPMPRKLLRDIARSLGWRWDPQRAGGAWYCDPSPANRVAFDARPGSLLAKGPPSEFLIAKPVE
jgi:hypothetical protein